MKRRLNRLSSPFWTLSIACATAAVPALAEDTTIESSTRTVVMLLPGQSDPTACQAELEAVQDQLADLPAVVELAPLGPSTTDTEGVLRAAEQIALARGALLVFWTPHLDGDIEDRSAGCSAASRVYLYARDTEGGRILVRDLGRAEPGAEAQREALAVIVRSTLRVLLQGEQIEGEEVPPAAPPVASRPPRLAHLDILAQYGLFGHSSQLPLGHGARLGLLASGDKLLLGLAVHVHARSRTEALELELERRSAALEMLLQARLGKGRWRFTLGAGAWLERAELRVTDQPSRTKLATGTARWVPGLSPYLGVSVEVAAPLWLELELGADAPLERTKYTVLEDGQSKVVLEGFVMRPFVRLGGRFAFVRLRSVRR